jgi:AraC-like DNA-binding protein
MKLLLLNIVDLPEKACRAGYSVKRLAKDLGMSEKTIERYCHDEFGISPEALLKILRVDRAFLRLANPNTPIKVLAAELSYKQPSSLWRDSKSIYKMAPTDPRVLKLKRKMSRQAMICRHRR